MTVHPIPDILGAYFTATTEAISLLLLSLFLIFAFWQNSVARREKRLVPLAKGSIPLIGAGINISRNGFKYLREYA